MLESERYDDDIMVTNPCSLHLRVNRKPAFCMLRHVVILDPYVSHHIVTHCFNIGLTPSSFSGMLVGTLVIGTSNTL